MLVALNGAWIVHWTRHRETAKGYAHDPVMAQFWGAPPMALMTVGDGTLLPGKDWIGLTPALTVDWALWTAGTALGLFATLFIVPQIWQRLVQHKTGAAASVPTVWIVLGPLGQSITAANLLANDAAGVLPAPLGPAASAFGLFYGVPTWGFAAVWMALTLRAARQKLPFFLTWWSFTFPVGTVVTGTSALSARIHAKLFTVASVVLYLLLVAAWITVAIRTAHGSYRRYLFQPMLCPAAPGRVRPPRPRRRIGGPRCLHDHPVSN
jgi:tellurite resistance protein TehA-like permease